MISLSRANAHRIVVTDAGTGATNNLIRSLRAGGDPLVIVGCHSDRFLLKKSSADRHYLVPPAGNREFAAAVARVVERERAELVFPNTDWAVRALSDARARIPCRVFLPARAVVNRCQDKYALTRFLAARGIPVPATVAVRDLGSLPSIYRRLGPTGRLWCRLRRGAGSRGAAPVTSARQAATWIRYWQEMRGVRASDFTLSEYLPGRDFACQMLWKDGALVLAKTCERLSYFEGGSQPSGRSSIAALARGVDEPRVVEVSRAAVAALGSRVTGAFSVDLKENVDRVPCVTEINVGRFITLMNLLDLTGKYNMARTYVRLALDEPVRIDDPYDTAPDYYFVRDVDTVPSIFHADDFFDGIEDARAKLRPVTHLMRNGGPR